MPPPPYVVEQFKLKVELIVHIMHERRNFLIKYCRRRRHCYGVCICVCGERATKSGPLRELIDAELMRLVAGKINLPSTRS